MGSRDKGSKETKKPKKGAQKLSSGMSLSETSFEPEVVKKKKKSGD